MDTAQEIPQTAIKMASVLQLAQACKYDACHSDDVTRFSLSLFDALQPLHPYGLLERSWLEMAGVLHDIGEIDGREGHHKTTLKIILNSPLLDLSNKERLIVGSIARYHRKSMPGLEHDHFVALEPEERKMVIVLSSFLRLADGLDNVGDHKIRLISVKLKKSTVLITCKILSNIGGKKTEIPKADLFEIVFRRKVEIKWSALL